MASFQDVITGSGNVGKSSLVYMLLLTNVLGLSIFLEKNIGNHPKINKAGGRDVIQDKMISQPLRTEELPTMRESTADEEIMQNAEKFFDETFKIGEDDNHRDDSASEKVIDFREAVKEIKVRESLKETMENLRESKEPLKALVWHFPKATSKR
ncbi:MAG: hypothetical protein NUV45_10580 [Tepidanaerobacteraceae bacterium]|jgi:hypothetical protein|nr:hypothetical protein [Tepidanaerobacteraceae bacterium]